MPLPLSERLLFSLQNVSLRSGDGFRLRDVTLDILAGITVILGYSGAGKTSLLNLLTGFEFPDAGTVVRSPPADASRLPLFWVPQSGGLWSHLTVRDHLRLVIGSGGSNGNELQDNRNAENSGSATEIADELLDEFGLTGRQHALPGELSQGERSRLSVVRALAAAPEVLVMDEPLAHVDVARKREFWDCILRRTAERKTSLVFSAHEPETVLRSASTVVCLTTGRVSFQGSPLELYHRPPGPEVAQLLGPVNWFANREELESWLVGGNDVAAGTQAVRPERVSLRLDDASPLQVARSTFCGAWEETLVVDTRQQRTRLMFHRTGSTRPPEHTRVAFSVESSR